MPAGCCPRLTFSWSHPGSFPAYHWAVDELQRTAGHYEPHLRQSMLLRPERTMDFPFAGGGAVDRLKFIGIARARNEGNQPVGLLLALHLDHIAPVHAL